MVGLVFFFVTSSIYAETYNLKKAQEILQQEGFNPGIADGIMGKKTLKALLQYQEKYHLKKTGQLNKETWLSLTKAPQTVIEKPKIKPLASDSNKASMAKPVANTHPPTELKVSPPIEPLVIEQPKVSHLPKKIIKHRRNITLDINHYQPKITDKKLVIGVPAQRSVIHSHKKWDLLAKYLSANVEGYTFELRPLVITDLYKQSAQLDYILGNPKLFVQFEYQYGFRPIVTLRNQRLGQAYDRFGIVLFTKKDSPINTIADFRGKKIGMLSKKAWGGWVLGWHTMIKNGFDPYKQAKDIIPLGSHLNVVDAVRDGTVDVGVVRTDVLERSKQEDEFKIIHPNTEYGDQFPFQLSSKLYPEWVFAASSNTDDLINRRVAALLLSLDGTSEISKKGKNEGWTISANYQGVHTVLKDLRLPPYENYGKISFVDVLKKYWVVIVLSFLLFVLSLIYGLYFRKLSKKLAQSNANLLAVQNKLIQSEKMASIGTMVAGITHEINTPLAFAKSNITLIKEEFKEDFERIKVFYHLVKDKIIPKETDEELIESAEEVEEYLEDDTQQEMIDYVDKGLDSVSNLVLSLKNYSRVDRPNEDVINLNQNLDDTLLIANSAIKQIVTIEKKYGDIPDIECSPSQINQVIMNILMNAIQAIEEKKAISDKDYQGIITLETGTEKEFVFLKMKDNGIGLKKGTKKQIFDPMFTTKEVGKGMGMGLSLSKQIIDNHQGTMMVESKENEGCTFIIKLPIKQAKEK